MGKNNSQTWGWGGGEIGMIEMHNTYPSMILSLGKLSNLKFTAANEFEFIFEKYTEEVSTE